MKKIKNENFWLNRRANREQETIKKDHRELELLKIVAWCHIKGKLVEFLTANEIEEALVAPRL